MNHGQESQKFSIRRPTNIIRVPIFVPIHGVQLAFCAAQRRNQMDGELILKMRTKAT
jgi:hypothetical protein